jgi:hypothetical protein
MEEILDLEDLQENVVDENLKGFMTKDEEAEKLLKEKIDELVLETEKLNKKEEEIKSLEESSREKISMNASPDELIEIAEKIKSAQSELSEINANIEKLEKEKEELDSTKKNVEDSKREYIKNLNSTNLNYQEQIKKIEEAIAVCDNSSLKQALEDVKKKKESELLSLQESRNTALKTALNPIQNAIEENNAVENESKPSEEKVTLDIVEPIIPSVESPVVESNNVDNVSNSVLPDMGAQSDLVLDLPKMESPISDNIPEVKPLFEDDSNIINNANNNANNASEVNDVNVANEAVDNFAKDIINEEKNDNMIGLDSILNVNTNNENNNIIMPELKPVQTDTIEIKKEESPKVKIIFEKNVPEAAIKEIYSSSTIMPGIYDYLNDGNNIINAGGALL